MKKKTNYSAPQLEQVKMECEQAILAGSGAPKGPALTTEGITWL